MWTFFNVISILSNIFEVHCCTYVAFELVGEGVAGSLLFPLFISFRSLLRPEKSISWSAIFSCSIFDSKICALVSFLSNSAGSRGPTCKLIPSINILTGLLNKAVQGTLTSKDRISPWRIDNPKSWKVL